MKRPYKMALGSVFLACTLTVGLAAQTSSADTDAKIVNLEKQLEAMRAELDALKSKPVAPAAAPVAPTAATETAAAPAAEAPPNPLAGITSVLGGVNLTGLADVYYGYNANNPPGSNGTYPGGTLTEPFTYRNNRFGLNLIELQLDKPVDKTTPLGFRVAVGFGDTMNAINGASNTSGDGTNSATQYLKEGYLSYMAPIGKGLQLDFGKFVTPAGVEVIETNQNWNYTRGLLFYYAVPYYHFGARAKYTFNSKWSITGLATNGWNNVSASNSGKTGGFSLAWNATKKVTLTETYLVGPRDLAGVGDNGSWNNLSDTVLAYNPTAKLSLQGEFDYDHQGLDHKLQTFYSTSQTGADYTGFAVYVKYAFGPKVAVAGRYEYLNDHDGLALGANGGLFTATIPTTINPFPTSHLFHDHPQEFTATLERKFAGHLISRLEYRYDDSNKNIFVSGGKGPSSFVGNQNTVDLGLVFVLEPAK
jgi:hypothetical protein